MEKVMYTQSELSEAGTCGFLGKDPMRRNTGNNLAWLSGAGFAAAMSFFFGLAAQANAETLWHSFGYGADGTSPTANLIYRAGYFYGTTATGGRGDGTVFKINAAGVETVLYSFQGGLNDGANPTAGLIRIGGTFYGTTASGGRYGDGTVFKITTAGVETMLYSFQGGPNDGANPRASLINVGGTLYGTTEYGGSTANCPAFGCGTVFGVTTGGVETMLYPFQGGINDGANPYANLINVGGSLVGTTVYGGPTANCGGGCGTVIKITTGGVETMLYEFQGGTSDGAIPTASLIDAGGNLYGTTEIGGAIGDGTVFRINAATFVETMSYSFQGGLNDGAIPYAGLIHSGGRLYGTTAYGGANGDGTVFNITTGGVETVLYSFQGGIYDGATPMAGLIKKDGALWGTTAQGGANLDGTVFSIP
jgi:uncharacterized repeat protein (TIGR03803 family)